MRWNRMVGLGAIGVLAALLVRAWPGSPTFEWAAGGWAEGWARQGQFAQAATLVGVARGRYGRLLTGTGFFIARDGRLLTAAHVVQGCDRVDIAAPGIAPARAELLAASATEDIALLRVPGITPPAILRYGPPAAGSHRLFVLGYPGGGDLLEPSASWAELANPHFHSPPLDAREVLLMQTRDVGHGWSGGPIVDPATGAVVAITRGFPDPLTVARIGGAGLAHLVMAPGAWSIGRFLEDSPTAPVPPLPTATAARDKTADATAVLAVRQATVHVFCWQRSPERP